MGSHKSKILSCNNGKVVATSNIKSEGVKIKKGTQGKIVKQRRTAKGHVRATINFSGKGTVEIPTSKLKCL